MKDAEMIAEARRKADSMHYHRDAYAVFLRAIAARLEQLTTPPAGCPVSAAEEQRWRNYVQHKPNGEYAGVVRDLLALADWERAGRVAAEGILADFCADHEALAGVGVARAAEKLRCLALVYDLGSAGRVFLQQAAIDLERECAPAPLPPPEATWRRMRALEAAVREALHIVEAQYVTPGGDLYRALSAALEDAL